MQPQHKAQLIVWIQEEIKFMRQHGVTQEEMESPAICLSIAERLTQKHLEEIEANPELCRAMVEEGFRTAPPEDWRKLAADCRSKGKMDLAYKLETLADEREREGWE
jgi:hypothetical protein